MSRHAPSRIRSQRGQSMIEFAMVLPMVVLLALGVVEVSWALLDGHVVTRLAREGSNLISRDTALVAAAQTMQSMRSRPVDFNNGSSKIIFSVLRNIDTVGAANYNNTIVYQRYAFGTYPGTSRLNMAGSGSFPAPDYEATNPNGNTGLRVTNLPPGLTLTLGGYVYVTEIFSQHQRITPFDRLGVSMPTTLYSIAYF